MGLAGAAQIFRIDRKVDICRKGRIIKTTWLAFYGVTSLWTDEANPTALGLPALVGANLALRKRQRGFAEAQFIESISLLQAVGGECPEDMHLLAGDDCLARGLGYGPPKATAVREFLERFHDQKLESLRPKREVQKSFIFPSSQPVSALQAVLSGQVRRIATVDQDATIIESHKQAAYSHYEEGRGYQPMVAVWAEADLVLADEFRDGNVPARQGPLTCAKLAFGALPETVTQRYFRGDSACHENELLDWLKDPYREKEPGGRIGFAVSACMSPPLAAALRKIGETGWKTFGTEEDGTLRQWAEVDFVPGEKYERKESQPLRYVGLRLLKPQGVLFHDGTDRHFHAVVTNQKIEGGRLLDWHREKAGTVEHTHDEVKNELGGGHVPSQRFGVNSVWFKISLLTYNLVSAIKGLCLEGGGTDGPDEAVSFVADPCGWPDEPEQLRDGTATVPRCGGAQTDAAGVASL